MGLAFMILLKDRKRIEVSSKELFVSAFLFSANHGMFYPSDLYLKA